MNEIEAAAITLSGLLESVQHLNEDSADELYQMLARAIHLQSDRLETIKDVFQRRVRAKNEHRRTVSAGETGA